MAVFFLGCGREEKGLPRKTGVDWGTFCKDLGLKSACTSGVSPEVRRAGDREGSEGREVVLLGFLAGQGRSSD